MSHLKIILFIISIALVSAGLTFGQVWKMHQTDTKDDLVAIYFTSSTKGFVAGDNGYLASTVNGGKTWQKYPLNTTENINEIYFRNEKNGYLVAGKKLFITGDGGNLWRETVIYRASDFKNGAPSFLSIRFADKKRGIVVGSVLNRKGDAVLDSLVMRTEDGGVTWNRVAMPTKSELFHLDYNGSSHGWIVGNRGLILATADGGATWQVQNSGTDKALYNVDFRDDNEGYAVGELGTILRTENGGASWQKVTTAFPGTFMRVDFADDKNGLIVGHRGLILRCSDKGRSWIKMDSSTTKNLYGLYMVKKYGWTVGADGLILEYLK